MENEKINNFKRRFLEFVGMLAANWQVVGLIIIAVVCFALLIWTIGEGQTWLEWREVKRHEANAANAAEKRARLETTREQIKTNANAELEAQTEQGKRQNEKLNNSLNNLNRLNNRNSGNVSGAELDADAANYANRSSGGSW